MIERTPESLIRQERAEELETQEEQEFESQSKPSSDRYGWPSRDTLAVNPALALPGAANPTLVLPAEPAPTSSTMSILGGFSSLYNRVTSWLSWGSESTTPEKGKVEEITPENSQSLLAIAGDWAGRIWNLINVFGTEKPQAEESSSAKNRVSLAPLSNKDRIELERLLNHFHRLFEKLRDVMTDAELDELMMTIILLEQQGKIQEFNLHKATALVKQRALKDLEIKRLKEVDFHIEEMKRNKWWGQAEDLAAAFGFVNAARTLSRAWIIPAACYAVGKYYNSQYDNYVERQIAKGVAKTGIGSYFNANAEETERGAFHLIQLGFGILTSVATLALKLSPASIPTLMEAAARTIRALSNQRSDVHIGEMGHLAFQIREANKAADVTGKNMSKTHKQQMGLAKKLASLDSAKDEAARAMIR